MIFNTVISNPKDYTPLGDYFGDGSDGDLVVAAGQEMLLPVAEDAGQIIKQYNNGHIEVNGLLKPDHRNNGTILLFTGDLIVDGTISVDKCAPLLNPNEELALSLLQIKLCGPLKGGKGGKGGNALGGIGGEGHELGGGFPGGGGGEVAIGLWDGGASRYTALRGGNGDPRPPVGITWPYPSSQYEDSLYTAGGGIKSQSKSIGGNSPGGSGGCLYYSSNNSYYPGLPGDAYPGGGLWIFVKGKIIISATGIISANGGNGGKCNGNSVNKFGGAGGGAGGGIIAIIFGKSINNAGTIRANGGLAGDPGNSDPGENGTSGTLFIKNISELI